MRRVTINSPGKPSTVTINAPGKPSTVDITAPEEPPGLTPSQGVIIGDSTLAAYLGTNTVASYVFTPQEITDGYSINSLAESGDGIAEQRTLWNALGDYSSYEWVWVQVGLNNVNPAQAVATTMSVYQSFINDIRADKADIKIIVACMSPGKGAWPTRYPGNEAAAETKFQAMNDSIMGIGSIPITGVDMRVDESYTMSVDGSGYLKSEYELGSPDGIHPNNTWREILGGTIIRGKLMTYGW